MDTPLADFHPAVAAWFRGRFDAPTLAQARAWPAIRAGQPTLVAAPTGSGKTLTAFLAAIDALVREGVAHGGSAAGRDAGDLRVAAEGAVQRHPYQPGRAAGGHPRRAGEGRPARRGDPHRRAHRRHPAARAAVDAQAAAAHPGDHARIAVHPARLRLRSRHARHRPHGDRRRDPCRGRRASAARTWRCRWSGWTRYASAGCCGSGCRRRRSRSRRWRGFWWGRRSLPLRTGRAGRSTRCTTACRTKQH